MKGKKESAKKKNGNAVKATQKPGQGELSEKDMQKVTGGIISPRDPQSGLSTG
jgi:bacteriocin-like protein